MYDVAIVGAGVIGSAVARELSRSRLSIVVLEKGSDAAVGASKANSGIVHAGYDAHPGSLKAKYNIRGNALFDELAGELDFPFQRIGSLVLAFSLEEAKGLEDLKAKGDLNGVPDLAIMRREDLNFLESRLDPGVHSALYAPTGGIVCPYEMTIALAENAAANGVDFLLNCEVARAVKNRDRFTLETTRGTVEALVLVNAAGLYADWLNNQLSRFKMRITPRRGQYLILDRSAGDMVRHTLFQMPGPAGKGILITPTVDGNLLLGPTSELVDEKDNTETTLESLERIRESVSRDVMDLPLGKTIGSFAGLRAHLTEGDFVVGPCPDVRGLINVAGIESPGLTSAPAIAHDVADLVFELVDNRPNLDFNPLRLAAPRFRHMSRDEQKWCIEQNPDFGTIVCRCENVTKAEIVSALRSPLGISDLDAIKRRTRAGMGRCQGGFCGMRLPEIIAEETGLPVTAVTKFGGASNILLHPNKSTL